MIQDTSFVVDVIRGDGSALDRLADVEARNRPEKVSAITVLELYEGIQRTSRPEPEKEEVLAVLDSKTVLAADHGVMQRAGTISGRLFEQGEPIDREDCVVAATAIAEGEPVLTGDPSHFERVDGLEVLTY